MNLKILMVVIRFCNRESPFLLITEDHDGVVSYCWWDSEEGMIEDAIEREGNGEHILHAIEIGLYRNVEIPEEKVV